MIQHMFYDLSDNSEEIISLMTYDIIPSLVQHTAFWVFSKNQLNLSLFHLVKYQLRTLLEEKEF